MSKDSTTTKEILVISLAIFGIVLSITKRDFTTLILLISLTISAIIIMILLIYIKKIDANEERINKIKENFKISERLNKLELRVFKK